jgi:hypothetical protein
VQEVIDEKSGTGHFALSGPVNRVVRGSASTRHGEAVVGEVDVLEQMGKLYVEIALLGRR